MTRRREFRLLDEIRRARRDDTVDYGRSTRRPRWEDAHIDDEWSDDEDDESADPPSRDEEIDETDVAETW